MSFEKFNIKPEIIRALKEQGIVTPTLIQEKVIPLIESGKDVIGMSETGSGKTAAFGVPILNKLVSRQGLQVLIIVPTRELAVQISKELFKFGKYISCSIATVYGGVSITPQIKQISQADIVVGTPGRLLDHLQRRTIDFSSLTCVVLDEADIMVNMGFIRDIERLLNSTPKDKQIHLFGATLSDEINRLKIKYMSQPISAQAEKHVKSEFLKQYYYDVEQHEKFSLLVHLLKKEQTDRVIIFCSTRLMVEAITKNLREHSIRVEMIHGRLNQNRRLRIIENFHRDRPPNILVASAVAARGLDIKEVTHIFNYDLSRDPQEYVHRVGRTARAGESGKAITLLSPRDHDSFNDILKHYSLKIVKLPKEQFPKLSFDDRGAYSRFRRYNNHGSSNGHRKHNQFNGHGRQGDSSHHNGSSGNRRFPRWRNNRN